MLRFAFAESLLAAPPGQKVASLFLELTILIKFYLFTFQVIQTTTIE